MSWARAFGAYFAWLAVHAVAGFILALVALATPLESSWYVLVIDGLVYGALFGAGEWLVLERILRDMRWWIAATVLSSPISWFVAIWLGIATAAEGGWAGWFIVAAAQTVVLAIRIKHGQAAVLIPAAWFVASIAGGMIFYAFFVAAVFLYAYALVMAGSVGYAAVTGIVVAVLAARPRAARS